MRTFSPEFMLSSSASYWPDSGRISMADVNSQQQDQPMSTEVKILSPPSLSCIVTSWSSTWVWWTRVGEIPLDTKDVEVRETKQTVSAELEATYLFSQVKQHPSLRTFKNGSTNRSINVCEVLPEMAGYGHFRLGKASATSLQLQCNATDSDGVIKVTGVVQNYHYAWVSRHSVATMMYMDGYGE